MLADDDLGRGREDARLPLDPGYIKAFEAILADPHQLEVVVERQGQIVGCCQITFIPGLTRRGMTRALLESVRIAAPLRGQGIGRAFFEWILDTCRSRGAGLVQLTSDKSRARAHGFYASLGFIATHEGFKLTL